MRLRCAGSATTPLRRVRLKRRAETTPRLKLGHYATVTDTKGTYNKYKFEPVELKCDINLPINPCKFCFSLKLNKRYQNTNVWITVQPPYPVDTELVVNCDEMAKKTLLNTSPYLAPGRYEISLYGFIESCAYAHQFPIVPSITVAYEFDVL